MNVRAYLSMLVQLLCCITYLTSLADRRLSAFILFLSIRAFSASLNGLSVVVSSDILDVSTL